MDNIENAKRREVGQRIKLIRTNAKKTQDAFAESIGLTQNFISLVETGARGISGRSMKALCKTYRANPEWIHTGVGDVYIENPDDEIAELCRARGLNECAESIVRAFLALNDQDRKGVINFIRTQQLR